MPPGQLRKRQTFRRVYYQTIQQEILLLKAMAKIAEVR